MKEALFSVGIFAAATYTFWILFLAAMSLIGAYRAGTISTLAKILGYPIIIGGIVLDFLFNLVVLTVIMIELPREALVTKRLQRHFSGPDGWRKTVALFICSNLLDTFDPSGSHCGSD